MDAGKRVQKVKGVTGVRNEIQVAGPSTSDAELRQKIVEKLQYDRVGHRRPVQRHRRKRAEWGGNPGRACPNGRGQGLRPGPRVPPAYPGVKDVVDEIEVDPTSITDDQTLYGRSPRRVREF